MSAPVFPTKGNLMAAKKSLALAQVGFDLMDRKRNILIREMMDLIDRARDIQDRINSTFQQAYAALQMANISTGTIQPVSQTVPIDDDITILRRSVMGVEIPQVHIEAPGKQPQYSLASTNADLDQAYICFTNVKQLCAQLAEVETSVYRLAIAIKKTQKRVGALKNIIIPDYQKTIAFITDALEEKERDEFIRLKVIKRRGEKKV